MKKFLISSYLFFKPVLGQPLKSAAHWGRRTFFKDSSQLGESLLVKSHVISGWPEWFVDVGANDGVTVSNSLMFLRQGWNTVLVEPNPDVYEKLTENVSEFMGARPVQAACSESPGTVTLKIFSDDPTGMYSKVGTGDARDDHDGDVAREVTVQSKTLTSILEEQNCPSDFSVLSVDTEGHDLAVFHSLDFERYSPRVIITEIDEDGSGEAEKSQFLAERDYSVVGSTQINLIWKRNDLK